MHLFIRAVFAVLVSVTDPLLHQTLFAMWAAVFGGADRCFSAALLIRAVPAVRVTITTHRARHTLATCTCKLSGTAALISTLGDKCNITMMSCTRKAD